MTHAGYAIAGSCHFPPSENNSVLTGRHESEHQTCHGTRRPSRGLLRNATSSWRTTVRRPGDRGGGRSRAVPRPAPHANIPIPAPHANITATIPIHPSHWRVRQTGLVLFLYQNVFEMP